MVVIIFILLPLFLFSKVMAAFSPFVITLGKIFFFSYFLLREAEHKVTMVLPIFSTFSPDHRKFFPRIRRQFFSRKEKKMEVSPFHEFIASLLSFPWFNGIVGIPLDGDAQATPFTRRACVVPLFFLFFLLRRIVLFGVGLFVFFPTSLVWSWISPPCITSNSFLSFFSFVTFLGAKTSMKQDALSFSFEDFDVASLGEETRPFPSLPGNFFFAWWKDPVQIVSFFSFRDFESFSPTTPPFFPPMRQRFM